MPETPTASDLEKAHLILREFGLLIGPGGELSAQWRLASLLGAKMLWRRHVSTREKGVESSATLRRTVKAMQINQPGAPSSAAKVIVSGCSITKTVRYTAMSPGPFKDMLR